LLSEIDGVLSVAPLEDAPGDLTAMKLTCAGEADLREAVYNTIKQTDWVLMEFRQETKSLETIFRELTKEN
jgi:ABC-2 type transport system ATP-binding protein